MREEKYICHQCVNEVYIKTKYKIAAIQKMNAVIVKREQKPSV